MRLRVLMHFAQTRTAESCVCHSAHLYVCLCGETACSCVAELAVRARVDTVACCALCALRWPVDELHCGRTHMVCTTQRQVAAPLLSNVAPDSAWHWEHGAHVRSRSASRLVAPVVTQGNDLFMHACPHVAGAE